MNRTLICLAALACSAAVAHAADLPVKAPRSVVVPPYGWTGFYAGVQGGYEWSRDRTTEFNLGGLPTGFSHGFSPSGGFGGVHVGYNYQFDRVVLGIEGDVDVGRASDGFSLGVLAFNARKDWEASIRGRLGVTPIDRLLLYVTGGVAFTELKYHWDAGIPPPVAPADANIAKTGWTVGAGGEAALTNRVTARLEYRYSDFGTTHFDWPSILGTYEQHPRFQSVRGGVSVRF